MSQTKGSSAEPRRPDDNAPDGDAPLVTGSEAMLRALIEEGVEIIFGYPGGAIMPAYDALYDFSDRLRHVLVRHEQGAVHAAEGYARATGRAGVCVATSGPGATNLVTGIADAMLDSVPIVCITGQVSYDLLGSDAFQETDVIGITIPITKWNTQVRRADEVSAAVAKAFYIAQNGRPGPVLIDITKNAQVGKTRYRYERCTHIESFRPHPPLNRGAVAEAARLINEAERPYILAGHGVQIAGAEKQLIAFAEKGGIPVACTLHGLSVIPASHPLYVGMLGMHGHYGPNVLTNAADVIIAVGMRFDDRVTGNLRGYAPDARVVHIDIDAAEIDKNVRTTVPLIADAKEALSSLIPHIERRDRASWLTRFAECSALEDEKVIRSATTPPEGTGVRMSEVIHRLSERTRGEAIVVADVGQHQMMAARYYRFERENSWICSGGLGTMGFALPAGIGALMGASDRTVVVVAGDGGFQMTLQELGTIAQEQLPVKVIILNNNFLGMVRQWQELFFERRYSFVELKNPDFVKIAEAFGVPARKVTERRQLDDGLRLLLDSPGPFVLEVVCEREENVFPMVPAGASVTEVRLE